MNINKNTNNNINFSQTQKDNKTVDTPKYTLKDFCEGVPNMLIKKAEFEVPENGKFSKKSIAFDIPNTKNEAFFTISHDETNPKDLRTMSINVRRLYTDRLYSHILCTGTKQEVLDYLANPENYEEFENSTKTLSDSVDEYYD